MKDSPLMKPFDRELLKIVRYGLFAVFFLPFVVLDSYLYPWVTGKIWGLELLVGTLFPLWVVLAVRRKEFRPSRNVVLLGVLAYFAVATLSMLLGDDPHRSMWSKPDRLTAMFYRYHLLGFFLMASTVWRGMGRKVAAATALAATIAALHGIGQAWFGAGGGQSDRGSATFGNPSYLAQFLVPSFFLCLWLIVGERSRSLRWLWGGGAGLMVLGMLAAKSRGALVAMALSGIVMALYLAFRGKGKERRYGRWVLAGLAALGLLYVIGNNWSPGRVWLYEQRISVQYFEEASGSRQLLLRNALKGFKDRPVLGWGPENFESAFYYHYDPVTFRFSEYETRQDRPHNIVLEVLVNLGVVGFLAWAAMFVLAWKALLRRAAEDEDRLAPLLLATASFSLLAFNLFIFESAWSWIMEFLLLALIAAAVDPSPEKGEDRWSRWWWAAGSAALALSLFVYFGIMSGTIRASKLTANMIMSTQRASMTAEEFSAATDELMSLRSPLVERDVRAVASHLSTARGTYRTDAFRPILEKMADFEARESDEHPGDYVLNLVTATSLMSLPERGEERQAAMEKALDRMHALSPNRQEVHWIDGYRYEERGEFDMAEALYRKAVELDPELAIAHAEYARFLIQNGFIEDGVAYLGERPWLLEDPQSNNQIGRAMIHYYDRQDFETLYRIYKAGRENGIEKAEWLITGATAAAALGNAEEAKAIAAEVKERYPDRAQLMDAILRIHEGGEKESAS